MPLTLCDEVDQYLESFENENNDNWNYAVDIFDRVADKLEDATALWFLWDDGSERHFSYRELSQLSRKLAGVLQDACGVKQGDVVMLSLPRSPEWWICVLAIDRLGAVHVPSSSMSTEYEKKYHLQYSQAAVIICGDSVTKVVDKVSPECPKLRCKICIRTGKDYFGTFSSDGNSQTTEGWMDFHKALAEADGNSDVKEGRMGIRDSCAMFFTSGTTGRQKLAMHTPDSMYITPRRIVKNWLSYGIGDVYWQVTDLSWVKVDYTSYSAAFMHGVTIFCKQMATLDFNSCLEVLSKYPITHFCAPPTAYRHMVKSPMMAAVKLKSLKRCYSGGEAMSIEVSRKWRETFQIPIREGYGQTEMGMVVYTRWNDYREGSIGAASEDYGELVILDDNLKSELGPDKEGVMACRVSGGKPRAMFQGYKDDPERTAAAFQGDYFITGDRATKDDDGYYYYKGRADDIIITYLGSRIGPTEVESVLVCHPDVVETAVVSSPDQEIREAIKAFVVTRQNRAADSTLCEEIKEVVRNQLGESRVPHKIEFVDKLPKTSSGKVMRSVLRKQEWGDVKK